MAHRLFRRCRMLSVRSGFPCTCISSHSFLGDTCQLCPSYGCWHHVRGLVSSVGHFGVAHLGVDSLVAAVCLSLRACDFIRPPLFVAAPLDTVGCAHPFVVPNWTPIHGERIFAPTQAGTSVTESRQGHVREHTARIR